VKAGPGETVEVGEEIRRTAAFVAAVRRRHPSLVISVDTWRAEVGRAVCEAGADLLNDAWQGFDPGLAVVAAEFGAGLGVQPRGRIAAAHRSTPGGVRRRGG
jgi:dihydropteroate synthase